MKKLLICLFAMLSANAFSQSPVSSPSEESTPEIAKLRDGLSASFKNGDIDKLLTFLDPNVVVTWQNGEVCRGPDEVKAFYHRMMSGEKRVVREIKSEPEIVGRHVYGDWAVSWGNLHDHFVLSDGSDLPFNSIFTATIAKRGDAWLVTAFHASVNVFDNPVLKLGIRKTSIYAGLAAGAVGLLLGIALVTMIRRKHT